MVSEVRLHFTDGASIFACESIPPGIRDPHLATSTGLPPAALETPCGTSAGLRHVIYYVTIVWRFCWIKQLGGVHAAESNPRGSQPSSRPHADSTWCDRARHCGRRRLFLRRTAEL